MLTNFSDYEPRIIVHRTTGVANPKLESSKQPFAWFLAALTPSGEEEGG